MASNKGMDQADLMVTDLVTSLGHTSLNASSGDPRPVDEETACSQCEDTHKQAEKEKPNEWGIIPDIGRNSVPCPMCSCTPHDASCCRNKPNIQLFVVRNLTRVWSLGSKYVLKEMISKRDGPVNQDAETLRFLGEKTSVPVPAVLGEWDEDDQRFLISERVPDVPLMDLWPDMTQEDKARIEDQVIAHVNEWRQLKTPKCQSVGGGEMYNAIRLFKNKGKGIGPIASDDEMWENMRQGLENKGVSEEIQGFLRDHMPPTAPYTFTHADLALPNIMVENGINVSGIIDFEHSGFFPVWWELICTHFTFCEADAEWKGMLKERMTNYRQAVDFWGYWDYLQHFEPDLEAIAQLRKQGERWDDSDESEEEDGEGEDGQDAV